MTIKELVLQKINEVPESEPILKEILEILETKAVQRTFKGRPLLRPEDAKKMDCDLPPEPEWESMWNEDRKK